MAAKERQAAAGSPPLRSVLTLACAARSRAGAAAAGLLLFSQTFLASDMWHLHVFTIPTLSLLELLLIWWHWLVRLFCTFYISSISD